MDDENVRYDEEEKKLSYISKKNLNSGRREEPREKNFRPVIDDASQSS